MSIKRQCELLEVCRSSFYYVPRQEGSDNQELMKLIDKQYMETPFYGVLRMTEYLRELGHSVNPKRIRRLYRLMDLHAIGPRPNTSKPHKGEGHTIFPYLLRNLEDYPSKPGLGNGYHLCSGWQWLYVPCSHYRPLQPLYCWLVAIEHNDCGMV